MFLLDEDNYHFYIKKLPIMHLPRKVSHPIFFSTWKRVTLEWYNLHYIYAKGHIYIKFYIHIKKIQKTYLKFKSIIS